MCVRGGGDIEVFVTECVLVRGENEVFVCVFGGGGAEVSVCLLGEGGRLKCLYMCLGWEIEVIVCIMGGY